MKKFILVIFIVLCDIVSAQNIQKQNHSTFHKQKISSRSFNENSRLNGGGYQQPQSIVSLLDSSKYWTWDTITRVWKIQNRDINYTYDTQNRNTGGLGLSWNGTTWVNAGMSIITYSGNVENELVKSWDTSSSSWVNSSQITWVMDANNNVLNHTIQNWNTSSSTWVNTYQSIYTYNAANKLTSVIDQEWSSSMWYNVDKGVYSYNTNNIETAGYGEDWDFTTHALTDSVRFANTIDGNNNIISSLQEYWNFSSSSWDTTAKDTYTYDANHNQTHWIELDWNPTILNWDDGINDSTTYDSDNNVISDREYIGINNTWQKNSRYYYTYDANKNKLSQVNEYWTGDTWAKDSTYNYYHTVIAGIEQITKSNIDVNIYPNPNNGSFVIEPSSATKQSMQVYDVTGKLVLSQTINGKTSIDASGLNEGVYNISLQSNEGVVNKRLVIVR